MSSTASQVLPSDETAREHALDTGRCILVQAPAGSGKTSLLTRRFLRLLGEVDDPGEIVAITFTKAAAAEMQHRIVAELEMAAGRAGADEDPDIAGDENSDIVDELSTAALAVRALERSRARGWNLVELPAQLRITTIDAFCREIAIQQPLLSGLGGGLDIFEGPQQLYRRAARRTLEQIDSAESELRAAIESLLLWRDNGWREMEDLLVDMLAQRDRWMQGFLFAREPDWDGLRERLERPFARAARQKLLALSELLDRVPRARAEALELARFACEQKAGALHQELAELAEFPEGPFDTLEQLEEARQACACLGKLLLTDGKFFSRVDKRHGFPANAKAEKGRLLELIADLRNVPGLEESLAAVGNLPPAQYTDEDWAIVRACFVLLRRAAAELKVVFAEAAATDYTEVAQVAGQVLAADQGAPGETALAVADGVRHLLVDEFQDTSRRQHQLLTALIAAWPEREGRSCFVVGDPMQSIYFFRDADAELFPRVRDFGLQVEGDEPLLFDAVRLSANFRTAPQLVDHLNGVFEAVFAQDDGSGVRFEGAQAARNIESGAGPRLLREAATRLQMHWTFMPRGGTARTPGAGATRQNAARQEAAQERNAALEAQLQQIVALIGAHGEPMERARAEGRKYRVAVLGRTRKALTPVAQSLRAAGIAFRAVELEPLKDRPEVLDALALARALLNPHDRVAWLGVLRAPWCGLSLNDLHILVSADDAELQKRPVPGLIAERQKYLSEEGRSAGARVQQALAFASALRAAQPAMALGAWMEQVWLRIGGAGCVDAAARANLDLLWRCLDGLPEGEQDVLSTAFDAALEKLTALPDPGAGSDCGVQLMTIHKAKGLEFEVVIVPELQGGAAQTRGGLLAWMERGLAEPDECGEATEFLVAPIAHKGAERGKAKAWVDRARRERETQELRRLLYVAATRAREELHLFARPEYKRESEGALRLVTPKESLLSTAWPAVEGEVQQRFDEWTVERREGESVGAIAAAGEENLLEMPRAAARATVLRRLPLGFEAERSAGASSGSDAIAGLSAAPFYQRHEGGLLSRALGIAVHRCLQELARLRQSMQNEAACAALGQKAAHVAAEVRGMGIVLAQAQHVAAQALEIARNAARDAVGQWILSPHSDAASEERWAGVVDDGVRAVQVDRLFRAGVAPGNYGADAWWVIDYKTAHAEGLDVEKLRALFAPQLDAYVRMLRHLHGAEAKVFAGLYYPRMLKFDWWEA